MTHILTFRLYPEAETRLAFLGTLSTDIINPLITLKVPFRHHFPFVVTTHTFSQDTQDRIRKRIREDLKDAVNAHSDYAENVYPKLKRSYLKKAQEVEVGIPPSPFPSVSHILPYHRI